MHCPSLSLIFTARKRSLRQGNIFTPVCLSVILFRGDGIPACIAGGIPACLAAGGSVLSQHALQQGEPGLGGRLWGVPGLGDLLPGDVTGPGDLLPGGVPGPGGLLPGGA